MAFFGTSCQETDRPSKHEARPVVCVQAGTQYMDGGVSLYGEGILSSPIAMSRIVFHSDKRAETRTGERLEPSPRGGGKVFKACRAPHSAILTSTGCDVRYHSVSIRSFASRISLIYVLRRIIR